MNPNDLPTLDRVREEFHLLQNDLTQTRQDLQETKELLFDRTNRIAMLDGEISRLTEQLVTERARTHRYMVHSIRLASSVEQMRHLAAGMQTTAVELAQQAAEHGLEDKIAPEDLDALKSLAGRLSPRAREPVDHTTALPPNDLRRDE